MTTRDRKPALRGVLAAATLLCAAVCAGCSDDSSADFSTQCLALLSDEITAPGNVTVRTGPESTCNELDVELVVADVSGILAADIQVTYANGLAILTLVQAGPLLLGTDEDIACGLALSEYGVDCFVTDSFENGTVDFGITRTEQSPGTVDAPPEGAVLATLTFLQITTLPGANGPLDFTRAKLIDNGTDMDPTPRNIIDLENDPGAFVGGQLIIQQR